MSKFTLDYDQLDNKLHKKAYKLSEVEHQLETIAFDIVRFKDQDKSADLWQIQSADDGEYIVALYQPEEEKVAKLWDVSINKIAGDLQISYKGDPLVRLNSSRLGISRDELNKVPSYLPEKLAHNKKMVKMLLNELSPTAKTAVYNKYPELV